MTVGEKIRQRRIELNMSQDELAKKAGYKSRSSINKIELSRDLPLDKIQKVAIALDCSPYYLAGWEEKEDIIKDADEDYELITLSKEIKEYALKIANLSEEDKKYVFDMIDRFNRK